MTRINVVDVTTLCRQHLLAEFRELTRIPNMVNSGKLKIDGKYPPEYTLGTGHIKFFIPRLKWLHARYEALYAECKRRGYEVVYKWPESVPSDLYNDWKPSAVAVALNQERIDTRLSEMSSKRRNKYGSKEKTS